MHEYIQRKLERVRIVRDFVREEPRTLAEIASKIRHDKRTVKRYIAELKVLGDVEFDAKINRYISPDWKMKFRTEKDYQLALDHSRKLLFTTAEEQLFDYMDPYMWADEFTHRQNRHVHLLSHIKTGYFATIWVTLESYRKLRKTQEATGLGVIFSQKKIKPSTKIPNQISILQEEIIKEFSLVMAQVKHGTPLKGVCRLCPTRMLTVED